MQGFQSISKGAAKTKGTPLLYFSRAFNVNPMGFVSEALLKTGGTTFILAGDCNANPFLNQKGLCMGYG